MNKRHVISLIIAGIVMTSPVSRCLAQADEPKDNNVRQMQILLRTEGLDIVSPERKAQEVLPSEREMLPPGQQQAGLVPSVDHLGIGRQRLQPQNHQTVQKRMSDTTFFREQLSQQIEFLANQGTDVQKLRELIERLQLALESSEKETTSDIAVAVFAVPGEPQQRPEGSPQPTPPTPPLWERPMADRPGFKPPMLMRQGHMLQQNGPRPQMHESEGRFADEKKRIAALSESAERLAQAGMPDVAQGLRERAGQIKKELAEKQERIQHEERERAQAEMRDQQEHARQQRERMAEQRRELAEHDGHPALPLRELHEKLEQLQREVHSINEKVSHLTEMIEHHHRAQERQSPREEMEDDDRDEDDDNRFRTHERDRDRDRDEERSGKDKEEVE